MSVSQENGNMFTQLDPHQEAPVEVASSANFITDFIDPFSKPLHDLSDWDMAGEQRHIDNRVALLKVAEDAYNRAEYYLAKSCIKQVLNDVLHSNDLYVAEHDPVAKEDKNARYKVALYLLSEAPYRIDAIAHPPKSLPEQKVTPDEIDNLEHTIVMEAVA